MVLRLHTPQVGISVINGGVNRPCVGEVEAKQSSITFCGVNCHILNSIPITIEYTCKIMISTGITASNGFPFFPTCIKRVLQFDGIMGMSDDIVGNFCESAADGLAVAFELARHKRNIEAEYQASLSTLFTGAARHGHS